jgi:hypothetical protein
MIRCNIQCRFGFERDSNGCEICRCFEPCQVNKNIKFINSKIFIFCLYFKRQQCPNGYECVIIPEQIQCVQVPCPVPRVECQLGKSKKNI